MTDPGPVINQFARGPIQQALEFEGEADTLSVCMIVKDEAETIREAIENFQAFADEIVVVDTGSTDGTLDLLKELPVVLLEEPWQGDFSAARNKGLDAATSSWIMWMDADDRIAPASVGAIKAFKKAQRDRVFVFELINAPLGVTVGESFYQIRIFPNDERIRFKGKIHENVREGADKLGLHRVFVTVKIHHTGYSSPEECRRKAERNLEMLLAVPEEERDALNLSRQADAYAMMQDWEQAIVHYKAAREHPSCATQYSVLHRHLPVLIGRCYASLGSEDDALKWYQQSIVDFEDKLDAYCYAAQIHLARGELDDAENAWTHVLRQRPNFEILGNQAPLIRMYSYDGLCTVLTAKEQWHQLRDLAISFLSEFGELVEPRWHLGRAYCKLLQYEEALRFLEAGLIMYPKANAEVWDLLFECYEKTENTIGLEHAKTRHQAFKGD